MTNNPINKKKRGLRITREARGRVPGDGVELAFGYWPGRGAPVVALHGLTASYLNFTGIAESLRARHALLAFDLRGRGDSEKPEGPYGLAQHARDVAAAMRALDLGSSIIVGHSMGAFVATALAAQNPELVGGLVLIDGGYAPDPATPTGPNQSFIAAVTQRVEQLARKYPTRSDYREFWRGQPQFPPSEWNPWVESFLDYEVAGEAPVQPKASLAAVRADLAEALQRDVMANRLKSVRVPTLLLRAERGNAPDQPPLLPDEVVPQMQALVPQLEDIKLAGTTHYTIALGEQAAVKVANLICNFAAQVRRRAKP